MACSGQLTGLYVDTDLDLAVEAKGLRLDDRLRDSLPDQWRAWWRELAPGGVVDLSACVSRRQGKWARTLTAVCRDASLTLSQFPVPRCAGLPDRSPWRPTVWTWI